MIYRNQDFLALDRRAFTLSVTTPSRLRIKTAIGKCRVLESRPPKPI